MVRWNCGGWVTVNHTTSTKHQWWLVIVHQRSDNVPEAASALATELLVLNSTCGHFASLTMGDPTTPLTVLASTAPTSATTPAAASASEPTPASEDLDDDIGVPDGFWEESEILAVIAEVHARRSVDTLKLFGGGTAELGERLSRRTPVEVKMLINRCKGSFDAHAAPWVPKCGVPELLAVLASEAAFCRNQRMRRASGLKRLASDKLERARMEAARRDGKRDVLDAAGFLKEEEAARIASEADKQAQSDAFTEAKTELDEEKDRGEAAEDVLQVARLRELEARRKLDRARIRVAALRGEFVTSTLREFVRPSLAFLRTTRMPTSEEAADAMSAPTPHDCGEQMAEKNDSSVGAGFFALRRAPEAGSDDTPKEEDNPTVNWEQAEGKETTELRLLRNRLSMHMTEATEWHALVASERNRARLLQVSRSRLEREVPMTVSAPANSPHGSSGADGQLGGQGSRLPPKARGKRSLPVSSVGDEKGNGRGDGVKDGLPPKRRRKSVPVKALVLLPTKESIITRDGLR